MLEVKAAFKRKDTEIQTTDCVVEKVVHLSSAQFDSFSRNLLRDWDFIRDNPIDNVVDDQSRYHCLLVLGEGRRDGILVNAEGSSYARYSAYLPGAAELFDADRYPALTELNQKLKDAAEFIIELGYAGNPTSKYAVNIGMVEYEYDLSMETGSQLFRTLVHMLSDRPEIDAAHLGSEEILVEMKPDIFEAELLRRGMNERASFEVFIANDKVDDDGKSVGDWLPLPATAGDLAAFLERIGVQEAAPKAFHIVEFRSLRPDIVENFSTRDTLDTLNMAASYLADMKDFELGKLRAILTSCLFYRLDLWNTATFINLLHQDNFDAFDLIDVKDYEQLGRYWAEEKPDRFSYEEYGRIVQNAERGVFTECGYIHFRNKELIRFFDGVVPEEYRITEPALKSIRSNEMEREKPSVLEQIREAKKGPPSAHRPGKTRDKGAPELEL